MLGCLLAAGLTLLAAAASAGTASTAGREAGNLATPQPKTGLGAYGALPISFVPNAGQLERRVRYSARAAGASFFFTKREAVFSLARTRNESLALRLRFVGANPRVEVAARKRRAGRVNYLHGSDRSKWRTNVPTYGEVVYRDLWPGIDLVFGGEQGRLKYELHVAPGASADQVRLAYSGASGLSLDRGGNLRIRTSGGTISDAHPVSYQQLDGRREPVTSRFLLTPGAKTYGFALAGYDRSRPLVIDPGLAYSAFLGGGEGYGIAVDGTGNAYVTGGASTGFTAGAFGTSGHLGDVFVTKLNATGSALVYSTLLGGDFDDVGFGIRVDAKGSAYVTGRTGSSDFPTTQGAFERSPGDNVFVAKLNATGSALVYSTYLGTDSGGYGSQIAVDHAGNAYVTGAASTGFPTTPGAYDRSYNGGALDVFVTKLNAAGSARRYSTYLGGSGDDHGLGIAVDRAGNAYVTGETESERFPTTAGAFERNSNRQVGGFVTKLNAAGSALRYSTYLRALPGSEGDPSVGYNGGLAIAVDRAGSAYVTGFTPSENFPTTARAFLRRSSYGGVFVTKLNVAGSALVYSTYLGVGFGQGIAVDATGNAYVTGKTSAKNFPTTAGAFDRSYNDNVAAPATDAFVAKLNATGSALVYSTYLGADNFDRGEAIAVDGAGSAYITGSTLGSHDGFPTTPGTFAYGASNHGDGAFVTKIDIPQRCLVPAVVGMPLARATTTIRQAGCSVGQVSRERSKDIGLVIQQRPRAGTTGPKGTKVNLVVGRR